MSTLFADLPMITKGELLLLGSPEGRFSHLLTDSRKLISPEDTVFFALNGKRLKGIDFIVSLYEQGVRNFIVEKKIPLDNIEEANVLIVKNVVQALQDIVIHHRKKFHIPIIGITGSNGKTIVKEWLFQLLQGDYEIVRNPKSYNSQIGVPLSVWRLNSTHQMGIFEAGISEPDEMQHLEAIIKPSIGIFTNIGEAHSEGFFNSKQKIREKLKLFKDASIIIYCSDQVEVHNNITELQHQVNEFGKTIRYKSFTWGMKHEADIAITSVETKNSHTEIEATYKDALYAFELPFTDKASIENALHCFATMLYLDIDKAVIQRRMALLTHIAMRLEMKEGNNQCIIINDSYNSDINALRIAVDFLNQQSNTANKTVILSDILQSGRNEDELYKEVIKILSQNKITRLFAIGSQLSMHKNLFQQANFKSHFYPSTEDFIKTNDLSSFKDQSILIKGARKFEFERISKLLEKKAHETVLEINLNAIAHNLNIYHSMLKPDTKIMVMIKAFAYGSGSYEIAKLLEHQKVDYLAVAYIDEGVELRKAGITLPILVLNPEISNFDLLLRYHLEPEIYSQYILEKFIEALAEYAHEDVISFIHIKLDTGMHRLGFERDDIPQLISTLKQHPKIQIKSILSHLAASDEEAHDEFTLSQINRFIEITTKIESELKYSFLKHILNSAGIARFKEYQMDMVRLGIGIYGIDSSEKVQPLLQEVGTLKTTISQIRDIPAGDSIGYSRKGIAKTDMRIAVVGIGYADGLNRRLSNGNGYMLIHGQKAPIVGNVCMDMTMLDISAIPDVKEGDKVLVFGKELSIQEISDKIGTIPYEVLTGISQRVKRLYFQE